MNRKEQILAGIDVGLSPEKVAYYRNAWSTRPTVVRLAPEGPGTNLMLLLKKNGYSNFGGCGCEEKVFQMDLWGVDGCIENRQVIINWLREKSQDITWLRKAWTAKAIPVNHWTDGIAWLVDESIRQADYECNLTDVTICISSFLRMDYLERCIRSIQKYYPTIKIVVADNSHKEIQDGAHADWIKTYPHLKWVSLEYDSGLSACRNAAVEAAQTKLVLIGEEDFLFTKETSIEVLMDVLRGSSAHVAAGILRNNGEQAVNWAFQVQTLGGKAAMKPLRTEWQRTRENNRYRSTDSCMNFFLAKRRALQGVPWDEGIKIGHEHFDQTLAWKSAGVRVVYTPVCIVNHDKTHGHTEEYVKHRRRSHSSRLYSSWNLRGHKALGFVNEPGVGMPPNLHLSKKETKRLLEPDRFSIIFDQLRGMQVGVVDADGNAGDLIIHSATRQLCDAFGVSWRTFDPIADLAIGLEYLLIFGGGNMGMPYEYGRQVRTAALATGVPCILLPQSWKEPETVERYYRAYVRDKLSQQICPAATLAPDIALGWWYNAPTAAPTEKVGVFLRDDIEGLFGSDGRDPIKEAAMPSEYLNLAAQFEEIVTDRLHFAIVGLMAGRKVTLLPNSYHKNRGMWETWLRDLGCEWADSPP